MGSLSRRKDDPKAQNPSLNHHAKAKWNLELIQVPHLQFQKSLVTYNGSQSVQGSTWRLPKFGGPFEESVHDKGHSILGLS